MPIMPQKNSYVKKTVTLTAACYDILDKLSDVEGLSVSELICRSVLTPRNELMSMFVSYGVPAIAAQIFERYQERLAGELTLDKSWNLLYYLREIIFPVLSFDEAKMKEYNAYFYAKSSGLDSIEEMGPYRQAMNDKEFTTKEQAKGFLDVCLNHINEQCVYASEWVFRCFVCILFNCISYDNRDITQKMVEATKDMINSTFK